LNFTTIQIDERTTKHYFKSEHTVLSFNDWISQMFYSEHTIFKFNKLLADSKFDSFFWEVKPITRLSINQPFEFVLKESKALKTIKANNTPFKKYFDKKEMVVHFKNLSGDAELIVPTPYTIDTNYAHLSKFVRSSESNQILAFWKKVVSIYKQNVNDQSKWLSTSGLGVHWLHVRVDSVPKYYQHLEYKHS